jgi:SPP1 gp7 family putative phage head morphogenesis protein
VKGNIEQELLGAGMDPRVSGARATTLMRLHVFRAYQLAQHRILEGQRDIFPFVQYISADDGRVRQSHKALHGLILPAASPFWHNHTPPWEFGCRCEKVGITAREAGIQRAAEADKGHLERTVMEGLALQELEQGVRRLPGITPGDPPREVDVRTPRERGESEFEWRPDEVGMTLPQVLSRYDAQTAADWTAYAKATRPHGKDGPTLWALMGEA